MADNFPETMRAELVDVSGNRPDAPGSQSPQRAFAPAAVAGSPSAEYAAELLTAPGALMQLSMDEARVVVTYMQPKQIKAGTTFIREGDTRNNDFMLLLLEGEVTVENINVQRTEPVTLGIMGPGSLIGEVGLLDTEPRSASCTASTALRCAVLARDALEQMIDEQPRIGAKFLLAVAVSLAARLRDTSKKLKLYSRLATTMQEEIEQLHNR
jgi:CRP/FNR family cyclic AMP-dependent transcriptional regulator